MTVSWKVGDGIIQHIDIKEDGKENAFSLGSTLMIGTEVTQIYIYSKGFYTRGLGLITSNIEVKWILGLKQCVKISETAG